MSSRLALGTAQFGVDYGIANADGKVAYNEVVKILAFAKEKAFDVLDTAIAYGESEEVLGRIGVDGFNVISKLPPISTDKEKIFSTVCEQVKDSLFRLKIKNLYGLLLHQSNDLLQTNGPQLIYALNHLKESGIIHKVGVSIYNPEELDNIYNLIKIDLVQAPLNLIDRRLETSDWLSRLHQEGVEVHTRSTFLQGLLLMPRNQIPAKFEAWAGVWDSWASGLNESKVSAAAACLSYPLSLAEVDRVVVGVDSVDQLRALIAASQNQFLQHDFSFMFSDDEMLVNPSNWGAL